jgi:hypothetical protein
VLGCTGAESYAWVDPATRTVKTRQEDIVVAWYATGGRFDGAQTGRSEAEADETSTANVWHAPSAPGPVRLWAVIRDARGGVGWQSYSVEVL